MGAATPYSPSVADITDQAEHSFAQTLNFRIFLNTTTQTAITN